MGHQATFFVTPKDTIAVETAIREVGETVILASQSTAPSPRRVDHLDLAEDGKPWLFYFLALPQQVDCVRLLHVPERGHWAIDPMTSPVIEFTRSFFDASVIRAGRVHFVDGFHLPSGEWVEQPPPFRTWARQVMTRVKKSLVKRESAYVGADAKSWLEAGGRIDPPWQKY